MKRTKYFFHQSYGGIYVFPNGDTINGFSLFGPDYPGGPRRGFDWTMIDAVGIIGSVPVTRKFAEKRVGRRLLRKYVGKGA